MRDYLIIDGIIDGAEIKKMIVRIDFTIFLLIIIWNKFNT